MEYSDGIARVSFRVTTPEQRTPLGGNGSPGEMRQFASAVETNINRMNI